MAVCAAKNGRFSLFVLLSVASVVCSERDWNTQDAMESQFKRRLEAKTLDISTASKARQVSTSEINVSMKASTRDPCTATDLINPEMPGEDSNLCCPMRRQYASPRITITISGCDCQCGMETVANECEQRKFGRGTPQLCCPPHMAHAPHRRLISEVAECNCWCGQEEKGPREPMFGENSWTQELAYRTLSSIDSFYEHPALDYHNKSRKRLMQHGEVNNAFSGAYTRKGDIDKVIELLQDNGDQNEFFGDALMRAYLDQAQALMVQERLVKHSIDKLVKDLIAGHKEFRKNELQWTARQSVFENLLRHTEHYLDLKEHKVNETTAHMGLHTWVTPGGKPGEYPAEQRRRWGDTHLYETMRKEQQAEYTGYVKKNNGPGNFELVDLSMDWSWNPNGDERPKMFFPYCGTGIRWRSTDAEECVKDCYNWFDGEIKDDGKIVGHWLAGNQKEPYYHGTPLYQDLGTFEVQPKVVDIRWTQAGMNEVQRLCLEDADDGAWSKVKEDQNFQVYWEPSGIQKQILEKIPQLNGGHAFFTGGNAYNKRWKDFFERSEKSEAGECGPKKWNKDDSSQFCCPLYLLKRPRFREQKFGCDCWCGLLPAEPAP